MRLGALLIGSAILQCYRFLNIEICRLPMQIPEDSLYPHIARLFQLSNSLNFFGYSPSFGFYFCPSLTFCCENFLLPFGNFSFRKFGTAANKIKLVMGNG